MNEIKRSGTNGRRAQSVEFNGVLYTAGITSSDLAGDITAQCSDIFSVIEGILARAGSSKNRILSANITLADMEADYGTFNAAWDLWVVDGFEPVRSVTGGALAVPEYKVKISVIAAL